MARTKKAPANKAATRKAANTTAPRIASRPAGEGLTAVTAAIEAGDAPRALVAALDAWRAARAPALADLVDALAGRIAAPAVADDLAWTKLAVTKDPMVLGSLLGSLGELPVSFLPNAAQQLAAFPDDPRIGRAAMTWIVDPPTQSSSTYPFWTQLYKLLERLGDTRVIGAIDERLALPMEASKQFPKAKTKKPSQFWGKYYAALAKTKQALAARPAATADKAAIGKLAKLAAKLPAAAPPAITGGSKPTPSKASKAEAGPPLARALAHATKQQVPETIAALLDAWRDRRAPALADLIDRATALLPSYRETLPVEAKAAHAAWQAAFDRDPAGELPRLLRHIHAGGAAAATEHVVALSTLPDDPRIAMRLAELASNINISPERAQYWKSTWELIARIRDPRVIAPLLQDFGGFAGTYYDHHRSGRRILGDFVLAPQPPPSLDAADHKLVNQLAAALAKIVPPHLERERTLVADVVASWDDDGPRLVYADWLMERDNLRGNLIVLACKQHRTNKLTKAEGKQHAELRGRFRMPVYLHGPFSDFKLTLERGLPSKIEATWNESPISWRYLPGDPLLPCLQEIRFATHDRRGRPAVDDLARVMLDPSATRLTRVVDVPNDVDSTSSDPRFEPGSDGFQLANALEPLVKAAWKRDGRTFLRR